MDRFIYSNDTLQAMTILYNTASQTQLRQKLRNNVPEPERRLWQRLRGEQLGSKFRRQYGVGRYVLDFYAPQAKLGIEIDGDSHYSAEALEKDKKRQGYIEEQGILILRFTNSEVMENIDGVVERIHDTAQERRISK